MTTTFFVGLACAGFAFYHLYGNWKLVDNGVRTTANVFYLDLSLARIGTSDFKYYRVDDYSDECFKTVVYYTKGGERIVWQSRISTDLPDWMRGDDVYEERAATILYSPVDPYFWEFDRPMSLFVNWFVLLLAGLGLMSLSFGPYDAIMRRLRDSDDEREAVLDEIREELYAPLPPKGRSETPTPQAPETRVRSAPPGVDIEAPVPMMRAESDESSFDEGSDFNEPAFAVHRQEEDEGEPDRDAFGTAEDPFADMR
ncbi:MAG: hypothetical protein H6819_10230 [Phycisphaerales bacterium]|nr:hypothetical protein [Phycisphaerales bacterium]MCB9856592.1 hypothetical protein [Phycisphaerales bacterium]MCB9864611.1 hypothetical protein [Phycisphaerales bacterium]